MKPLGSKWPWGKRNGAKADHSRRGTGRSLTDKVEDLIGSARRDVASRVELMRERSSAMQQASLASRRGSKKRALVPIAAGGAVVVVMFQMVAAQILAVNFTTGNSQMSIYSNYLDAQKAGAYLAASSKQNGSQVGVGELGILSAKLAGLCVIKQESIASVPYSFMITAGDSIPDSYDNTAVSSLVSTNTNGTLSGASSTGAITAQNLFINTTALSGFGNKISGLNLGQSADTLAASTGVPWPTGGNGPVVGNFGLYADQLNVSGLGGDGYGMNLAGNITLPKLSLKVVPGSKTQADCS